MSQFLISPFQLSRARHAGDKLLQQTCDLYRPDLNGNLPASPTQTAVKCSVEMVNRLANPGFKQVEGMPPETPVRFDVRFQVHADVRAGDMLRIRTDAIDPTWVDQEFTIVGVRTPAEYALFAFADAEQGAGR